MILTVMTGRHKRRAGNHFYCYKQTYNKTTGDLNKNTLLCFLREMFLVKYPKNHSYDLNRMILYVENARDNAIKYLDYEHQIKWLSDFCKSFAESITETFNKIESSYKK